MATKQFKTESKRILDLMINSIYTHKEIFLRELISNASDATDKIYYKALADENTTFDRSKYYIRLEANKDLRTLTITDMGIGMTKEELENNLGTIAKSGSLAFKNENEKKDDVDIIGQFGVGFYSAFMVADCVTVYSKSIDSDVAYKWESKGTAGYTIEECDKKEAGTKIVLRIKDNTEEENYDEFLEEYRLKDIVKKYSDFIRYPIKMMVKKSRPVENADNGEENKEPKYEEYFEDETLNSMVPIWRRNKNELKAEDYENFYTDKHFGYEKPAKYIHANVDGVTSYNAILYIPAHAPYDFYSKEFEKGLELYSNGVLIMEKCPDLLPDYFSFVQGLVDSADLSLNISRELLQHDRQLQFIAKKIREKIKSELLNMLKNEREKYEEFFTNFGKTLKFGVYNNFGANKEFLQDLLMFYSSKEKKYVTLDEYVQRMPEEQKFIYYACGESIDKLDKLPQTELLKDKGFEILYCTDDIDEFAIQMMVKFKEKDFKSVANGDLGLEDKEDEKEETQENKDLFAKMAEFLKDEVKEVKASHRLKSHPVCLSAAGALSIEMEKVLKAMPDTSSIKAEKVLEINENHEIFNSLKDAFSNKDEEKLQMYTKLLYDQARLIEGLPIDDPIEFTNNICKLMK